MANHLENQSLPLSQRIELADLALKLADAMIAQEIACFHNSRKHGPDDDTEALSRIVEDAINTVFDIRKDMQVLAHQMSKQIL